MKTLLLSAALPFFTLAVQAQEAPPAETAREAPRAQKEQTVPFLGLIMEKSADGVVVDEVIKDSPAAQAGLKTGITIVSIDGKTVEDDVGAVTNLILGKKPGDEIEIQWRHEKTDGVARVTLGSRPVTGLGVEKGRPAQAVPYRKEFQLMPEGDRRGFRYTPLPNVKGLPPAERQLKDMAPELELDPHKGLVESEPGFERPLRLRDRSKSGTRDEGLELEVVPLSDLDKTELKKPKALLLEDGREEKDAPDELRWAKPTKAPKTSQLSEKDVWDRVQKQVAGALKKSDLDDKVKAKVMQALEDARHHSTGKEERQAKLEAEIQKLEKASQEFQDRARALRDQLKKTATE